MAGSGSQRTTLSSPAQSTRSQKSSAEEEVVSTAKEARVSCRNHVRVSWALLQVHVITGKSTRREIKVLKAGSSKKKVSMETLKYAVVRRLKVRSEPDVRTLTKLTPQCRFIAL